MLADLRYVLRSLTRAYGFTLTVVLTLALGIGAAAAIFSVTDWMLFRSDPWPDKDRLVVIGSKSVDVQVDAGTTANPFLLGFQFQACRDQTNVFSGLAVCQGDPANVALAGEPRQFYVQRYSANFFRLLGIAPALGRSFLPEECRPGADGVVVISHRCWQELFGGAPDVLGRTLQVGQQTCKVVGVLPRDTRFPLYAFADVCRPFVLNVDPANPWSQILFVVGRLKPGATFAQAAAEAAAVKTNVAPQFARTNAASQPHLIKIDDLKKAFRPETYWLLVGAVGFLYAIACLNASNLMLVRALGKRRELTIRLAVGGSHLRIARLIAIESLGLSLLAALAAILVAHWVFPILLRVASNDPSSWQGVGLSGRVLGVMGALGVITSGLIAIVPAYRVLHADATEGLKEGGPATGESPGVRALRNSLVILQSAFAVILLAGAGLMVRSLQRLRGVDLGFDPAGIVKIHVSVPTGYRAGGEERLLLFQQLARRMQAVPGVREVAYGADALLPGYAQFSNTKVRLPDGSDLDIASNDVSHDFLRAAGLTLLRGRWLPEKRGNGNQVVINERLARRVFGDRNPLGQPLPVVQDGKVQPAEVVGVVRDVRPSLRLAPPMQMYCSDGRWPLSLSTVLLRMDRDPPKEFAGVVRRAVYQFDPRLIVWNTASIDESIDNMLGLERMALSNLKVLAGIALTLAVVGLFSMLSYVVDRRMNEFGVRMALGATPAILTGLVMRRGIALVMMGVAAGVAGALGLTRFLRSLLYETAPYDPSVYLAVAGILLAAAAIACWLPARRAARVDVARLLRAE